VRRNLDPLDEHDDATLHVALHDAGLYSLRTDPDQRESPLALDSAIASSGNNLSVGQRQIIALARALVRRSKLLILDEATSAIGKCTMS
jgi:ABC-type multidrug transport system fused ATPase/permease subunit